MNDILEVLIEAGFLCDKEMSDMTGDVGNEATELDMAKYLTLGVAYSHIRAAQGVVETYKATL